MCYLGQRSEATEAFKWCDGDRHLGLVVVIWVVLGILGVELPGKLLVGMGLDAERLVDGEDLEQEWELATVTFCDLGGHESLVNLDHVEQRPLGFEIFRRELGMRAHP